MVAEIDDVRKNGDTLGGVIEVVVHGLPPGLGSHVHWDRRLDSRLAGALMGVQSVKAVEVGDGLETARRRGSVGPRRDRAGRAAASSAPHRPGRRHRGRHDQRRGAARAGGDEADLHRAPRAGHDRRRDAASPPCAINQRSDACAVPRGSVVMEAMVALVLADAVLEKFGGDSVDRDPAQRAGLPRRAPVPMSAPAARRSSDRRRRARRPSGRRWPRPSARVPRHRPRRRGRRRVPRSPTSSSTHGEEHFRALEARAVARRAGRARRRAGPRRRRRDQRGHPRAAGRPRPRRRHRRLAGRRPAVGRQARRAVPGPADPRRQPAGDAAAPCSSSARRCTARWPRYTVVTSDRSPTTSSPRSLAVVRARRTAAP